MNNGDPEKVAQQMTIFSRTLHDEINGKVLPVSNYELPYENISGMETKFHAFLTPSLDSD
jgi:hypothetical protein